MIFLIGGPPRCGKTTLAQNISEASGVSWISADAISGAAQATVEDLPSNQSDYLERAYPKRAIRKLTGNSNEEMYQNYSSYEIADAYRQEAKASHAAIKAIVESTVVEGHDLIIEGYQLSPQLINELQDDDVRAAVLVRTDVDGLSEDLPKNIAKNDWAIQKTNDPSTYRLIAEMIVKFSEWFQAEAGMHEVSIHSVDDDFERRIDQLAEKYSKLFTHHKGKL